jgi:hypothetical protein
MDDSIQGQFFFNAYVFACQAGRFYLADGGSVEGKERERNHDDDG